MILLLDNYDSFTYNLADLIKRQGVEVSIVRNDEWTLNQAVEMQPEALIVSPGPGKPHETGIAMPLIQKMMGKIPILGVCLGHQLLAQMAGAKIIKANEPMHGRTSTITHQGKGLFHNLPQHLNVMRYHSLIVQNDTLPPEYEVTAQTPTGEIMAIKHRYLPLEGVQFHPESILTDKGPEMLCNWLQQNTYNKQLPNTVYNLAPAT